MEDADGWICTNCLEPSPPTEPSYLADGINYCINCIRWVLETALDEPDGPWPPRLGQYRITDLERFTAGLNDDGLVERFRERQAIEDVPIDLRVYCAHPSRTEDGQACGEYLQPGEAIPPGSWHRAVPCYRCDTRYTCMYCHRALPGPISLEICTPTQAMIDMQQSYISPERGRNFQICPRCHRQIELTDGCNDINCNCAGRFCFICGGGVQLGVDDEDEDPDGHWTGRNAVCPRWRHPTADNASYGNDYYAPRNLDAHIFEAVNEGESQWREAARSIEGVDRQIRLERRPPLGGDNVQHMRLFRLLISARHISAMLHNGLHERGDADWRDDAIIRRTRFAHHAATFQYLRTRLPNIEAAIPDLAGAVDFFDHLSEWTRRLRFQDRALPEDGDQCGRELRELRGIVEELLEVQYPANEQDAEPNEVTEPSDAIEQRVRRWIRALLIPVERMLRVMRLILDGDPINLLDSVTIRTERQRVREALADIEASEGGVEDFQGQGPNQRAAYDIAFLFANRMFEDSNDSEYIDDDQFATGQADRRYLETVFGTIRWDLNRLDDDNSGRRQGEIDELRRITHHYLRWVTDIIFEGRLDDNQLYGVRRLYLEQHRGTSVDVGPQIGRPIRLRLIEIGERIVEMFRDTMDALRGPDPLWNEPLRWLPPDSPPPPRPMLGRGPSDSPPIPSLSPQSEPGVDFRQAWWNINAARIATLETGLQQMGDNGRMESATENLLNVLRPTQYLLLRLWQTRVEHDNEDNRTQFDRATDLLNRIDNNIDPFEGFGDRTPEETEVVAALRQLLPVAAADSILNPRVRLFRNMVAMAPIMQEVERENEEVDDITYLEALDARFGTSSHLYELPDGVVRASDRRYTLFLLQLFLILRVRQGLHPWSARHPWTLRDVRMHGVEDTAFDNLREREDGLFRRVARIFDDIVADIGPRDDTGGF